MVQEGGGEDAWNAGMAVCRRRLVDAACTLMNQGEWRGREQGREGGRKSGRKNDWTKFHTLHPHTYKTPK